MHNAAACHSSHVTTPDLRLQTHDDDDDDDDDDLLAVLIPSAAPFSQLQERERERKKREAKTEMTVVLLLESLQPRGKGGVPLWVCEGTTRTKKTPKKLKNKPKQKKPICVHLHECMW